jgi:hypothetical protein
MKIMNGYSVIVDAKPTNVAIVEGRLDGGLLRLRFPNDGQPSWQQVERRRVQPVADALAEKVDLGKKYSNSFGFGGKSTLAELVTAFGYKAESRLRSDTLDHVVHQLGLARSSARLRRDDP